MRRIVGLWLVGALLTLGVACSSSPPPVPVRGVVTLEDRPLAGVRVLFIPQSGTPGRGGDAVTDDDGNFEISPYHNRKLKGLPAGSYKVVITKMLRADGSMLPPDAPTTGTDAKETVPEPFCNAAATPIKLTVEEGKLYDIPLHSSKK